MLRQYLGIFSVLSIGIIAGVVFSYTRLSSDEPVTAAVETLPGTPAGAIHARDSRITDLVDEVTELRARVASLEASLQAQKNEPGKDYSPDETPAGSTPLYQVSEGPVSMTEGLVAAGLDSLTAEQIARRQSAVELKRLELRDRAMRDGTMGSDAYRDDLMALRDEEVKVRNEVDPDIYDRYLYHTGQTNRVAVRSVMIGSAAENAGIRAGDVLLSYDGDTIYNYRDLRSATLEGEVTEFINMRVARDGQEMTMTVSRGALGVRLDALRVNPDEG